jgi:uncharacterized protein (DUF2252 family)
MTEMPVPEDPTPRLRRERGRALRAEAPRSSHGSWEPPASRRDPVAVLAEQELHRVPELLPIRHRRMMASPFSFLRGAAAVMAEDLAGTPVSGLRVQACGDAHLLNFGIFATPERRLVFDVNDFDETLPAPFEWDVKRLAASVVVAGRDRGFSAKLCEDAARAAAEAYRTRLRMFAEMGYLDAWYSRLDVADLLAVMRKAQARKVESRVLRRARRATSLGALEKLTRVKDGRRRIVDAPPLIEHLETPSDGDRAPLVVSRYRDSLADNERVLLDRYHVVDWARKVVGVGSVGTDDAVVLALGDGEHDPLFLQVKEAQTSVLERFAGPSAYENHGQRVVWGQRLMQAASDIFLGWTRINTRDYYVRQLRDMKGSITLERLSPGELVDYARMCGVALGRAHARSGDAMAISAYLGKGESFDRAIGRFASAYADQTEDDLPLLVEAVRSGRLEAAASA